MESTATTNHEIEFPTIGGLEEAYPGKITSLIMVPPLQVTGTQNS